jgi:hypothetical protein
LKADSGNENCRQEANIEIEVTPRQFTREPTMRTCEHLTVMKDINVIDITHRMTCPEKEKKGHDKKCDPRSLHARDVTKTILLDTKDVKQHE